MHDYINLMGARESALMQAGKASKGRHRSPLFNENAMKKIRIGKEIRIRWRVLTNGEPLPLTGRDLRLEEVNRFGRTESAFSIEDDNVVVFTFPGTAQKYLGKHTFTLWENYNKPGQTVVDSCDGVELVPVTCMEADSTNGLDIEEVELATSSLELGVSGDSAYETWLKAGHSGTEEDFLAWLRQPAETGAVSANAAAGKANDAAEAATRAATEAATVSNAASTAESGRATAEQARQAAEKERAAAEVLRVQAEAKRQTDTAQAIKSASEATDAANKAVENMAGTYQKKPLQTTKLLQNASKYDITYGGDPHQITEEEVTEIFGSYDKLTEALSEKLGIIDDDGDMCIPLNCDILSEEEGMIIAYYGGNDNIDSLGYGISTVIIMVAGGTVFIAGGNVDAAVSGNVILPGSVYDITTDYAPRGLETILGDAGNLIANIRKGNSFISKGYEKAGVGSASRNTYGGVPVKISLWYGGNTNPNYGLVIVTDDRQIDIDLVEDGGQFAYDGVVKIEDVAKQTKSDDTLKTESKTVTGGINELYDGMIIAEDFDESKLDELWQ